MKALFINYFMLSKALHIFQVDDDTLVNPFAMVKFLGGQKEETMKELICKVTSYSKPFRNPRSKYFVSKTEYRRDVYPPYCQGKSSMCTFIGISLSF